MEIIVFRIPKKSKAIKTVCKTFLQSFKTHIIIHTSFISKSLKTKIIGEFFIIQNFKGIKVFFGYFRTLKSHP